KSVLDNTVIDKDMFVRKTRTRKGENRLKKLVVIMDEVDGMSAGDRGGMAELIALIKQSKVPIICCCNDRSSPKIRSLANHCLDLRLRRCFFTSNILVDQMPARSTPE